MHQVGRIIDAGLWQDGSIASRNLPIGRITIANGQKSCYDHITCTCRLFPPPLICKFSRDRPSLTLATFFADWPRRHCSIQVKVNIYTFFCVPLCISWADWQLPAFSLQSKSLENTCFYIKRTGENKSQHWSWIITRRSSTLFGV